MQKAALLAAVRSSEWDCGRVAVETLVEALAAGVDHRAAGNGTEEYNSAVRMVITLPREGNCTLFRLLTAVLNAAGLTGEDVRELAR